MTRQTQFAVSLYNVTAMAVRETAKVDIAAPDVPAAYRTLREAVAKLKASRVIKAELNEQDRTNVNAELQFDVRRADEAAAQTALAAAGDIVSRNVSRIPITENSTSVTEALSAADEYVWVYSETPRWWSAEGKPVKLPPEYEAALRKARAAAERIKK